MKTSVIKFGALLWMVAMLSGMESNAQASLNVKKTEDKAFRAFLKRDYAKSLELYKQLDTLAPDPVSWYDYWIGMCLLSSDNKLAAIPYLEKAKSGGHTSFVIDYYLGRAYLLAGRLEEAKMHLTSYADEFLANGINFEHKETIMSEGHRIHAEKSLENVRILLAECDARLSGNAALR